MSTHPAPNKSEDTDTAPAESEHTSRVEVPDDRSLTTDATADVDLVVPAVDDAATEHFGTETPVPKQVFGVSLVSLCCMLVFGGAAVGGGIFVSIWLKEMPLRRVAAALDQAEPDAEIALFEVEEFLNDQPEHPRAMALRARALIELARDENDSSVRMQMGTEALRLFELVKASDSAELYAWAQALGMTQQWSSAVSLLKQVVINDPANANAWYELTTCRIQLGDFSSALESAQRLGEFPEMKMRSYYLQASVFSDTNDSEKAEEFFARILDEVSTSSDTTLEYEDLVKELDKVLPVPAFVFFLDYGRTLLDQQKPRVAIRQIAIGIESQRVALGMPTPEACVLMGNAAEQVGNLDGAVRFWDQALQLDPSHFPARELLANAALKKGDAKQALEWIKPMEPQDRRLPYSSAYLFQRVYGFLGNQEAAEKWQRVAEERREYEKRQTALRRLMVDKPKSHGAKVVRAHFFFTRGNVLQAKMLFEELNREDPKDQFVLDCLASINDKEKPFPSLDQLPIDTQF
ncbi:MAG: hypothetical protein CMJ59_23055 [Planctomycetaceae bacterium]|nr:hypothetical protein [Planctomycetaceae bacterium]